MEFSWVNGQESQRLLLSVLFFAFLEAGSSQLHYSVSEEAKHGTFVGRIAQDLGLELTELVPRLFRVAKFLDREETPEIFLVLTATDGGKPELTGTVQLRITVLDANDNAPVFDRTLYTVKLPENVPNGTSVIKVNASDLDEGLNGDIVYSFSTDVSPNVKNRFYIDRITGQISVHGYIDFEECKSYEILVEGTDKGQLPLSGHCRVIVEVQDINDNIPDLEFKSLSLPIRENAPLGTVIALISVSDQDSGANGQRLERGNKTAMLYSQRKSPGSRCLLLWLLLPAIWEAGSGQLHYSVPEEAKHGTFVGRIAQDLGLELTELVPRLFRVASKGRGDLLEVNLQNGILFVNGRIDREELCGRSAECSLHLEVIVDRPLQVFHVEVEVKDINDNPPRFSRPEQTLPDSFFPLEGAADADVGSNSALTYKLSSSEYFALDVKTSSDDNKQIGLRLKKSLDREEAPEHSLLLMATDGGKPELTGSLQLLVTVLDVNDNAPSFEQSEYKVKIFENADNGTMVIRVNASDRDEGTNGAISYSFSSLLSPRVLDQFSIDGKTGEIVIKGNLDFEQETLYKIRVDATDRGHPPMAGHCTVLVKVLDKNDNAPQIALTSLSLPVREDAQLGTAIALISVSDSDSGDNGQVTCSLTPDTPFKLVSTFKNYYSLVLDSALDRETTSDYELVVTARDGGSPPLWATASVSVEVADVNDNAPVFAQAEYTVFVKENNAPGSHIFTVWARDADAQENARVSYSLVERRVGERALSSYVSVHAESGKVYALQPLDHEELELLQFQVSARDAGVPALGSNVTLQVFVLDENDNDNAPALLGPPGGGGGGGGARSEVLSRSVGAGHVVSKVRAVDADSGYNAWLSYELQPAAAGARSAFRVGLYTGEISTTRALDEADAARQRLLVLVKDHGEPALTATATVLVSLVDSGQSPKLSLRASEGAVASEATLVDVNVYLIIAICAVCSLLVLTLVLYVALRCSGAAVGRSEGACAPGKPVLVCSSAVGSLTYSQQRRQRVCSAVVPSNTDLMAFSPSLPQVPTSADNIKIEEFKKLSLDTCHIGEGRNTHYCLQNNFDIGKS
ncbi:PREDICTED: LOW QUALITY PROTEIN: protocadherin alpha-6-like [Dipodomys ordii]|uniref:LOW QUALITY PROTEIN: protocadherin alpha-6-like n=1 Tax=Dipodomys ordii TaxID=10020 RepID=A0A1S3FHG9_DIPOR|nr:PREDICTED: LOW QUALITY PROTEIN: protocadherin alpha-6-like [Dipodomys ordii]